MTQTFCAKLSLIILGALLLPAPASTYAQSLGEIARQYRKGLEARKKEGEVPVRVFTNDDIARMPPVSTSVSLQQKPPGPSEKQLEPRPSATAQSQSRAAPSAKQAPGARKSVKSKEYWQTRFKAARAALDYAKEEQKVVKDELQLLQIQQARELDPDRSRQLNGQIDAAKVELETRRAATRKARQALEKLEKEFKKSGAPQDWIPPENASERPDAENANPSGPGAGLPPRP